MFNQRKNKSFSYKSRFSREANPVNPDEDADFVSKWKQSSHVNRKIKGGMSIKMLILLLVLLLIFMYVIDKKFLQ